MPSKKARRKIRAAKKVEKPISASSGRGQRVASLSPSSLERAAQSTKQDPSQDVSPQTAVEQRRTKLGALAWAFIDMFFGEVYQRLCETLDVMEVYQQEDFLTAWFDMNKIVQSEEGARALVPTVQHIEEVQHWKSVFTRGFHAILELVVRHAEQMCTENNGNVIGMFMARYEEMILELGLLEERLTGNHQSKKMGLLKYFPPGGKTAEILRERVAQSAERARQVEKSIWREFKNPPEVLLYFEVETLRRCAKLPIHAGVDTDPVTCKKRLRQRQRGAVLLWKIVTLVHINERRRLIAQRWKEVDEGHREALCTALNCLAKDVCNYTRYFLHNEGVDPRDFERVANVFGWFGQRKPTSTRQVRTRSR